MRLVSHHDYPYRPWRSQEYSWPIFSPGLVVPPGHGGLFLLSSLVLSCSGLSRYVSMATEFQLYVLTSNLRLFILSSLPVMPLQCCTATTSISSHLPTSIWELLSHSLSPLPLGSCTNSGDPPSSLGTWKRSSISRSYTHITTFRLSLDLTHLPPIFPPSNAGHPECRDVIPVPVASLRWSADSLVPPWIFGLPAGQICRQA